MHRARALAVLLLLGVSWAHPAQAGPDECAQARETAAGALSNFDRDPAAGLESLARAHALCPENPEIAYDLGLAQVRTKSPEEAYRTWESLAATGAGPRLALNLGRLALALGRSDQAMAWARTARRVDRSGPRSMDLLVNVLLAQGRYEEALEKVFEDRVWVPAELRNRVVDCAVESAFRLFRSGRREAAAALLNRWAETFINVERLDAARDSAVASLLDEKTPLPDSVPLPHDRFPDPKVPGPGPPGVALAVGVALYRDLPGVRFANDDAREVAHVLASRGGFAPGVDRVRVLTDEDATLARVAQGIEWLVSVARAEPGARVVFYFAGLLAPVATGEGPGHADELLLFHDAGPGPDSGEGRLGLAELTRTLREAGGDRAVAVLDGCWYRDGRRMNGLVGIRTDIPGALAGNGNQVIRAVSLDRRTREDESGLGLFTHVFLEALSGLGDRDRDRWVDAREAFELTRNRLKSLGLSRAPQAGEPVKLKLAFVEDHEN